MECRDAIAVMIGRTRRRCPHPRRHLPQPCCLSMAPRRPGRKSPTEGKGKQKARDDTSHATHSSGSDRSRRSVAKSDHQPDSTSTHWTVQDEEALLELALMNQAMMGNGGNFRPAFWSEVAAKFPVPAHGKPKTVDSCKDKWKRVSLMTDSSSMCITHGQYL